MTPFDYLKAINETKEDVMLTSEDEHKYAPFIVNRGLSFFMDTIFQANEVNQNFQLDSRLQFDYLLNNIRKKKRYSKWLKPEKLKNVELVKEYYGFSNEKAKDALRILSEDQLAYIKDKLDKGGVRR
ncbi:MAG: DNA polymerase [Thaumarchaeota archaeon]|nr:DNA polymerase [Nitrososphaerota archaeon]